MFKTVDIGRETIPERWEGKEAGPTAATVTASCFQAVTQVGFGDS